MVIICTVVQGQWASLTGASLWQHLLCHLVGNVLHGHKARCIATLREAAFITLSSHEKIKWMRRFTVGKGEGKPGQLPGGASSSAVNPGSTALPTHGQIQQA